MSKSKKSKQETAVTKKERVRLMLAANPTSVADIATGLSISRAAAYSLIGDLRRAGHPITGTLKDAAMVYSIAVPDAAQSPKRVFGRKGDAHASA